MDCENYDCNATHTKYTYKDKFSINSGNSGLTFHAKDDYKWNLPSFANNRQMDFQGVEGELIGNDRCAIEADKTQFVLHNKSADTSMRMTTNEAGIAVQGSGTGNSVKFGLHKDANFKVTPKNSQVNNNSGNVNLVAGSGVATSIYSTQIENLRSGTEVAGSYKIKSVPDYSRVYYKDSDGTYKTVTQILSECSAIASEYYLDTQGQELQNLVYQFQ